MAVRTKTLPLTITPLDLAADADVAAELARAGRTKVALQNGSNGRLIFIADRAIQPAPSSREGLRLRYADVAVYEIDAGDALWCWTSSTTGASMVVTGAG